MKASLYKYKRKRGAAYVLALTTMLVGMTLGLAMLRSSGSQYIAQVSRQKKQAAVDLAEAGVDYAYWKVHYQGEKLPYTTDVTTTSGTIHITATDDGNRDASMMLVTSTGTCGKYKQTIKRVVQGLLPYHYALCVNKKIDDADPITDTNPVGGVRTNDLVKLDNVYTNLKNGAWAANTISTKGSVYPQYPNSPAIAFPDIDLTSYASIATLTYSGDTYLTFPIFGFSGGVIYVNGKAYVSGLYSGMCTVVSTGELTVVGALKYSDVNSYIALMSPTRVKVDNLSNEVDALMYAHKSDNTATLEIRGYPPVLGSASGDNFVSEHGLTVYGDSTITIDVMRRLKLPGL
ncbi:MAG: hypothetical protein ABFD83_02605 [Armatimonadota bacterium]